MKKYFVISDIHSFYSQMISALKRAGYEVSNPDHVLIVCGDVFDRGEETIQTYKFLSSIPKDRCVLIKGNHETLFHDLLRKTYPAKFDFSNGTVLTFCQIAGYDSATVEKLQKGYKYIYFSKGAEIEPDCLELWSKIKQKVRKSKIIQWLDSRQWVNYYEMDKYIFVHAFIPLAFDGIDSEEYCIYYGWTKFFQERPDWRNATDHEWEVASWGCPYKFFDAGLFDQELKKGKVLVCGHYRCSEFNVHYLNGSQYDHSIYFGENLIAIDATTGLSGEVNVLVIDGNKCYDQNKNLLTEKTPLPIIKTTTIEE